MLNTSCLICPTCAMESKRQDVIGERFAFVNGLMGRPPFTLLEWDFGCSRMELYVFYKEY